MSSTEAFSSSGWQPINAPLPEGLYLTCAVTLNATAVLLIGGRSDSQVNSFPLNNINSYISCRLKKLKDLLKNILKVQYLKLSIEQCRDSLLGENQLLVPSVQLHM